MRLKLLIMSCLIIGSSVNYAMKDDGGDESHEEEIQNKSYNSQKESPKNLTVYEACKGFTNANIQNDHMEIVNKAPINQVVSRYFTTKDSRKNFRRMLNNLPRVIHINADNKVIKHKLGITELDDAYEAEVIAQLPFYQRYAKTSIAITAICTAIAYPYISSFMPPLEDLTKIFQLPNLWKK